MRISAQSAALFVILGALTASYGIPAYADTDEQNVEQQKPPKSEEETQNNRAATLEGSKSPVSMQFNISYSGSSINHPFIGDVSNPGGLVPDPVVEASGQIAARYRLDDKTSAGLSIGVTTLHPFQGPSNTTASNPAIDLQHSYRLGPIHNRADVLFNLYTDDQYHNSGGYNLGFTALNEGYYEFAFGLTVGLLIEVDANTFSHDPQYETLRKLRGQIGYDIVTDPYFEYSLSKTVNLRSVIGIQFLHTNDLGGSFSYSEPDVYQTLGVGIAITKAWYFYPFIQMFPYNGKEFDTKTIFFGFNTIFNLF